MNTFQDLKISINSSQIDEFISKLESKLSHGWRREPEKATNLPDLPGSQSYLFVCDSTDDRPAALLGFVMKTEQNLLYVANIVPREIGQLNYDQYNSVLTEFCDSFVRPIATELRLEIELTKNIQSIDDWICPDSAKKLRRFSDLANKSTGSSHLHDEERWFEFVISIVINNDELSATRLERWLVEDDNWPDYAAENLAHEFEYEIGILKYYREKHR